MKAVIMAGGRGKRIESVASGIPKPMIMIEGKPILEREIECLRSQGIVDIIITVSYLAEQITNYFGDGSSFGVNIDYYIESVPLGNAGALFFIRDKLDEDFLLINADSVFDIDINRFIAHHRVKKALVTIFTHPNSHPYDSCLIFSGEDGSVIRWLTKEEERPKWFKNRVNAGFHIINPHILDIIDKEGNMDKKIRNASMMKVDLDRQVLRPLCGTGKLFCYDSPEYIKDMGTPERYAAVCEDYRKGIVKAKNLRNKQKAVFLDRDGTINKYVGFLNDIDSFELLPGVANAIRRINESGYLAIVVTNQPVVARGELTCEQLQEIHNKMETCLAEEGAFLDAIYFCPHHPDKGFQGEVSELKVNCDCRKPKPGMILKAAADFNIDLESSWMIGDEEKDIIAGKSANCMTALIGIDDFSQNLTVNSLIEFVEAEIEGKN